MNKTGKSRASLFLIELILAVLFFSLGSGICIRAFAQAALISRSSADLSFASSQVSSAASVIRYSEDPAAGISGYFPGAQTTDDTVYVYFDENRSLCEQDQAHYIMEIRISAMDSISSGHISMTDEEDQTIYELDIRYPSAVKEEDLS